MLKRLSIALVAHALLDQYQLILRKQLSYPPDNKIEFERQHAVHQLRTDLYDSDLFIQIACLFGTKCIRKQLYEQIFR